MCCLHAWSCILQLDKQGQRPDTQDRAISFTFLDSVRRLSVSRQLLMMPHLLSSNELPSTVEACCKGERPYQAPQGRASCSEASAGQKVVCFDAVAVVIRYQPLRRSTEA